MYITNKATAGWSTRHRLSVVCLLLAFLNLQLVAGGLFGGSNPSIRQETVYLDTSTNNISSDKTIAPVEIASGVQVVPNTSPLGSKGLEGIGFVIDVPCQGAPRPPTIAAHQRPQYSRIALMALKNCTLEWQATYAQNSLARGVIIYSDGGDIDLKNAHFSNPIVIPVFIVDADKGTQMAQDITDSNQQQLTGTSNTLKKQMKLVMLPNERSSPSVWEFTLIIVVILLFLALVISVAMHCHLYRLRRNYAIRNNIPDGTEMMVIHKSALDKFPIQTWYGNGDLRSQKTHCAVVMEPPPAYDPHHMASPPEFKSENEEAAQSVCAVCLDDFKVGDEVRELPCCHIYHVDCIDPWLTTKSGTCPMCKLAISSDLTPAYLPPENTSWWYSIATSIFAPCVVLCR